MKKMRFSFAIAAFALAIGGSFASKAFTAGWYQPDKNGTYIGTTLPSGTCPGSLNLCATEYNSSGVAIATALQDD